MSSLAAVAVQGGTTRYDIPNAITVPDKNATMVMLLARRVPGEAIYLFAPDDGVPDSTSHPFHVVRFENGTGGVLERGPIAVFQDGSFLGQGLLDPLAAGAFATVKFALERAIAVDSHAEDRRAGDAPLEDRERQPVARARFVLQDDVPIQNGSELPAKLLVKHPRRSGARLYQPPRARRTTSGRGARWCRRCSGRTASRSSWSTSGRRSPSTPTGSASPPTRR